MINLCIDKSSILDVDESDIEDIKDQLLIIYRLLNACKRINYYLACANRDGYPENTFISSRDRFKSDLYIDSILIEIQKLTETKISGGHKVFGIRKVKNLCNRLSRKYKVTGRNCDIFVIDKGKLCISQIQYLSNQGEQFNTFDLMELQNREMDEISEDVSELKRLRNQIQAHSDWDVLKSRYNQIDVNSILSKLSTGDYLCGNVAGMSIADVNNFWSRVYKIYNLIKTALMRYTFILLSIYSRQRVKNSEIPVRALKFEDVQSLFQSQFM